MNGKQHPLPREPSLNEHYVVGEAAIDYVMPSEIIKMRCRLISAQSYSRAKTEAQSEQRC
ncbi:Uncharacterised protein [Citrobacter amalonaticus]|uniref:Uncharacterized protein n=1 Tax=Citrobacter amalonaticus TaxID=35703 RepID=A0A6N2U661_CITAM